MKTTEAIAAQRIKKDNKTKERFLPNSLRVY